ncbi:hypothetical protein J6590_058974 [Homalodisca vitripennis]|nr:hypothetical protein J6590_058974 [Homalodisca vitripennis]
MQSQRTRYNAVVVSLLYGINVEAPVQFQLCGKCTIECGSIGNTSEHRTSYHAVTKLCTTKGSAAVTPHVGVMHLLEEIFSYTSDEVTLLRNINHSMLYKVRKPPRLKHTIRE